MMYTYPMVKCIFFFFCFIYTEGGCHDLCRISIINNIKCDSNRKKYTSRNGARIAFTVEVVKETDRIGISLYINYYTINNNKIDKASIVFCIQKKANIIKIGYLLSSYVLLWRQRYWETSLRGVRVMVCTNHFQHYFIYIVAVSFIGWENHRHAASHLQILSYNVVSSTPHH
jgi:hypothetical protein